MKNFGKYLIYRLKEARTYFLIITAILSVIAISAEMFVYEQNGLPIGISTSVDGLYSMFALLVFAVPIYEFSGFMNRRNADTVFFLQIDKWHRTLAHYLTATVTVLSSMIVSFSILYIRLVFMATEGGIVKETFGFASTLQLLYAFLVSLVFAVISITITSFTFCCANTELDGGICSFMWLFTPALAWTVIEDLIRGSEVRSQVVGKLLLGIEISYLIPGFNILTVLGEFDSIFYVKRDFAKNFMRNDVLIPCAILLALAILAFVGMYLLSRKKKAEKIGDISDSWFSYKLLIPLYGIILAYLLGAESIIVNIFLLVAAFGGYVIYRRGFKLHKSDIIMMIVIAVISMIEIRL